VDMVDTVLIGSLKAVRKMVVDMSWSRGASLLDMNKAGVVDAPERMSPVVLHVVVAAYVA
jgi:hypothetical protein